MYEPIRTPSVHTVSAPDLPHRSRAEELDIRLAGHLTALLTVTDELRALAPDASLDDAAERLAAEVTRLGGGRAPLRAAPTPRSADAVRVAALNQRAHGLAGLALSVATAREDERAAALAETRLDAHGTALHLPAPA
jgi:hypothetical protein